MSPCLHFSGHTVSAVLTGEHAHRAVGDNPSFVGSLVNARKGTWAEGAVGVVEEACEGMLASFCSSGQRQALPAFIICHRFAHQCCKNCSSMHMHCSPDHVAICAQSCHTR